jgi:hypothetical protein
MKMTWPRGEFDSRFQAEEFGFEARATQESLGPVGKSSYRLDLLNSRFRVRDLPAEPITRINGGFWLSGR